MFPLHHVEAIGKGSRQSLKSVSQSLKSVSLESRILRREREETRAFVYVRHSV